MNQAADKGILLLLCIFFLFFAANPARTVTAFLLAASAAALSICLDKRSGKRNLTAVSALFCFFLPELLYFLPVLLYDCFRKRFYEGALLLLPFLYYMVSGSLLLPAFPWVLLYPAVLLLSWYLSVRTDKLAFLKQEYIRLRDSSMERNLALKQKNKDLMEKQDYEIYLATLKERNRIAREIHDHVGHMLSRCILQIGALSTVHREDPLHGELKQVNETLNSAMTNIRESVHDLYDDSIDLKQAVTEAVCPLRDRYAVTIDFDMSSAVPSNIKYCIISTVKEAVSNILKHSNADRVLLIFREHPGFYQFAVEDNGARLPSPSADLRDYGGIGLCNMRDRVEALNGVFQISTERGFRISFSIPRN